MKTFCIALMISVLPLFANANESNNEQHEYLEPVDIELENLMDELFLEKTSIIENENQQLKVIILNSDFRKVRVDEVKSTEDINSQSTLAPVIYRSEFIARIYNVSYYMLKD